MASKSPVQCPLCHSDLPPSEDLVDHLVEKHSRQELADSIVSQWEEIQSGERDE